MFHACDKLVHKVGILAIANLPFSLFDTADISVFG